MQFAISLIVLFATAIMAIPAPTPAGAIQARNLHTQLYCVDVTPAQNFQVGEEVTNNDAATDAACNAYRGRNTGTQPQDTCPDCTVGNNGGKNSGYVTLCLSAGKHLGGNEFTSYCKAAGATRGQA